MKGYNMKCFKKFVILPLFALSVFASNSYAQEAVNAEDFLKGEGVSAPASDAKEETSKPKELTEVEKSILAAKAELDDKKILAKKIALAKQMHKIRPTRDQVDSAVSRASLSVPAQSRLSFVNAMSSMLNYNAIERISVDAMIETYTLAELEAMVEYFSKPEAISASNKMRNWAVIVQPEIIRMIDKAMMRIKTGQ